MTWIRPRRVVTVVADGTLSRSGIAACVDEFAR
jgi:hypothetical protein